MKTQATFCRLATLAVLLITTGAAWSQGGVMLSQVQQEGKPVLRLENYRVSLVINPGRGGAVTSWSDKLAPADLLLQKPFMGLCMDHFQEQSWPGEFLEQPYEFKVVKSTPEEVQVMVWRTATGVWGGKLANDKLAGVLLEKTYTLRADSPALTCSVKLTAPADQAKTFAYWIQHVYFAGGDYDAAKDRAFRPSARGVRNTGQEGNGPYGREEWLRDYSDGWIAMLDSAKKSGLATITDYNDLNIVYACGGNLTNEPMFITTYQPAGTSRSYTTSLVPMVGLDKIMYCGPQMLVGYAIKTDNKGGGTVDFKAVRSALPTSDAQLAVTVVNAMKPEEQNAIGTVKFGPLTDQPQTQSLTWTGGPLDPVVIRVAAQGHGAGGAAFSAAFEDFFSGAYKWAENIQTDMRTPVYLGERPVQKLALNKPAKLTWKKPYSDAFLFFQGLLDEEYDLAKAVHLTDWNQASTVSYYSWSGSWYGSLSEFPYDYDKLLGYSGVILGGISQSALRPIGVEMLHDYLTGGGGMLVLGSHGAYGRSHLRGTSLGDALPVELPEGVFSLSATGGKPITYGPDPAAFLDEPRLAANANCWFMHNLTVKPGAQVFMQVDGKPFLVGWEYGPQKARVLCLLGAPLGKPSKDQPAFWQDPRWHLIVRNALWWIAREDEHFQG